MALAENSGAETGVIQNPSPSQTPEVLAAANDAFARADWENAAAQYGTFLRSAPECPADVWIQYAKSLRACGRVFQAGEALRRARVLDPANPEIATEARNLAAKKVPLRTRLRANNPPAAQAVAAPVTSSENDAAPTAPSAPRPGGGSLYCEWIWHAITVLCDGTVTCGLDDPFRVRSYGSVRSQTLREVFAGSEVQKRRSDLQAGRRCLECSMYRSAAGVPSSDFVPSNPMPKRVILEPSIKCNIRCNNETCNIANDPRIHLRREDFMPWPLFCKLMDEVALQIEELWFYNYGEPFVHPKALDMLAYARRLNPKLFLGTSTNGIMLARPGMAERIVGEKLLDRICFTIGGVDQASYERYHKSGSFDAAMQGMRGIVEEKKRLGRDRPIVHWRYLVFHWNDSDAHVAEALRLREEIGVDEFRFMLTGSPMDGRSLRRAPGTPGFEAIKEWVTVQDGYHPDPFNEAGLFGEERDPALGRFRWTAKSARFTVPVEEARIRVRLARSSGSTIPSAKVNLTLPWGDYPAVVGSGEWVETAIPVPDEFTAHDVPVELEVDEVFAPIRHTSTSDNRELGVMLAMNGISPAANPYRSMATGVTAPVTLQ
ncbi:MAG TPA: SPASM domain-containing protein [Rhizomicrobium sp.]|nr:SPASM domain-containing protein [Rhizomicrobium sp.]